MESACADPSLNSQPETRNSFSQLLRKEKDEASPRHCLARDSLMPSFSFCASEGFFIVVTPRWSL
jgi:hypothetical protein